MLVQKPASSLTFAEIAERWSPPPEEVGKWVLGRLDRLTPSLRGELKRKLLDKDPEPAPRAEGKTAIQQNLLDLCDACSEQMAMAKRLKDSLVDDRGAFIGTTAEVSKALLTMDKVLDTASKRYQDFYNVSTSAALEAAVQETLAEVDEDLFEEFMQKLTAKLTTLR